MKLCLQNIIQLHNFFKFPLQVMLVGAEDALYGISTRNGGKKKPVQIPGIGNVYQMSLVDELGLIIAIVGKYLMDVLRIFSLGL